MCSMKQWARRWMLLMALTAAWPVAAREETITISETRGITVRVPDGFSYRSGTNARGELAMTLSDAKEQVTLHVTFTADPEEEFKAPRARRERLHEEFNSYVAGSVEKAMRFEELEPKVGAGTYCVFTDEKLVGKPPAEYPPGEYLNLTAGVKAWPGVVATFTLFSNGTTSEQYRALMAVLRESVHEKLAPLR